ncbi:HD domain-containing phosphohydrolase [uncultured Desulfuromonas sp.]|uniref:response regulator n=1 Tax=uncultured Desulfuromonas sp. TaxID=181013 RepID=UPI002AABB03F|nr:HD domain-containing phosphohydrolase [uncultured Desulfuromonas sp.]
MTMINDKPAILVVDDDLTNIQVGIRMLKDVDDYQMIFATRGEQALERVKEHDFDLILLDILMQPMDGFEVCRRLKADKATHHIPVVFLTARTDSDSLIQGFELGGVDYVTKPFNAHELCARVKTHLELKRYHDRDIEETQREIILMMSAVCEFKSVETGQHINRVAEISALLARLAGCNGQLCQEIRWAAAMHDVGKVAIPDAILHKPARLTPQEFEIIKTHTVYGHDILRHSTRRLLRCAAVIAHQHHEHWDGSGYPQGLSGEEIDLRGRIVIIADVFDALLQKRAYKPAWSYDEVVDYMRERRGTEFDPRLLDLFFDHINEVVEIEERLKDIVVHHPKDM